MKKYTKLNKIAYALLLASMGASFSSFSSAAIKASDMDGSDKAKLETKKEQQTQPNIIVIMTDDQGQWTVGSYGQKLVKTPNIDYMAKTGVRFENAMTPAPVSSAARASFHTGKTPSQHGVHDFLSASKDVEHDWLKGETMLGERLKKEGYVTAMLGKWHATQKQGNEPVRGYDKWMTHNDYTDASWINAYIHMGDVHWNIDGNKVTLPGTQSRYLTEEAVRFIDNSEDKPFFININYTEPHFPFADFPERLVDQYRPIAQKLISKGGSSDLFKNTNYNLVPEDHEEKLAQYLAGVSLIDDNVGRLLDALESRKLLNNTVVVFLSDHGLLMGQYGVYGKVNATFPYNFYEETIRVPFIVKGPADLVKPRQVRGEFVDLLDLNKTILDFAAKKGNKPQTTGGPGDSLRPLLQGERTVEWRNLQFSERGNGRMVTNGHWKLVRYYKKDQTPIDHWYDLSNPMGERHISAAPRETVQQELITALETHFDKYSDSKHTGKDVWNQPPLNFGSSRLREKAMWE
ncbi:sulfatase-like hydrolase/transferase [Vibrio parahaemolyticus]|nr:sulfatase-like hydrolase/transferase [Vibrio parahaemolyticus]